MSSRGCAPSTRRSTRTGRNSYDFDMLIYRWGMSLSPGNEARVLLGGRRRPEQESTRNYPGVRDPVVRPG